MQQHGIRARGQRRFRVVTTDSGHDLPIAPHLLNRNFTVQAPNRTWSGDITYIPTEEGWLFLAVVIDLFSRRVVGWSMREDLHRSLVIDALEMGWFQRRPRKGELIFHSDRGSQYASEDFRQVLDRHGIRAWMSRRGNCWDNAVTETLFGSLKVERLHGERFLTLRQAKDAVLAWLLWYNQQRMHSTLNYVSPAQYEQQWSQARPGRGTDPGNRLRRFPHFHRHHHDGNMIPLTRSLRDTHSEGKIKSIAQFTGRNWTAWPTFFLIAGCAAIEYVGRNGSLVYSWIKSQTQGRCDCVEFASNRHTDRIYCRGIPRGYSQIDLVNFGHVKTACRIHAVDRVTICV